MALSASPPASSSARLASIIPAPVRSRRALTSVAVIVAIRLVLLAGIEAALRGNRVFVVLGAGRDGRRLLLRRLWGRRLGLDLPAGLCLAALLVGGLLLCLL